MRSKADRISERLFADAPSTLEQRLSRFDPAKHGGEAMASKLLGAEPNLAAVKGGSAPFSVGWRRLSVA